jgi:hypothetical protein
MSTSSSSLSIKCAIRAKCISPQDIDFHKLLWNTMAEKVCLEGQTGLIDEIEGEWEWIARDTGKIYVHACIFCTAAANYFDQSFRGSFCAYCPAQWNLISPYDTCYLPYWSARHYGMTHHKGYIYTKFVSLVKDYQKIKDKTSKTALRRKDWAQKLAILIRDVPIVGADRLPWSERKQHATKFYKHLTRIKIAVALWLYEAWYPKRPVHATGRRRQAFDAQMKRHQEKKCLEM